MRNATKYSTEVLNVIKQMRDIGVAGRMIIKYLKHRVRLRMGYIHLAQDKTRELGDCNEDEGFLKG
jgi:hypothetical protein